MGLAFAVAGCGQKERIIRTPVPVACVKAEQLPAEPASVRPQLTGQAAQDATLLAIAVLEWRDHAGKLRALLTGCME